MSVVATFFIMLGLWVVMSGKFDLFHLALGALSSALVAAISHDLLFRERDRTFGARLLEGWRFLGYVGWLFGQIVTANIHLISLSLSPRALARIDPRIISFRTCLKGDFARFVLANSITLTPGTVTIRIQDDIFYVHAINPQAVGDLAGEVMSEMERRVALVFEPGAC